MTTTMTTTQREQAAVLVRRLDDWFSLGAKDATALIELVGAARTAGSMDWSIDEATWTALRALCDALDATVDAVVAAHRITAVDTAADTPRVTAPES